MNLRPVRRDDAERIQQLVEDREVRAYTNMPEPYPADGARRWLETELTAAAAGNGLALAMIGREGLMGVCALRGIGGSPVSATLGYWLGKPYWGRGIATEAVRRVVAIAFEERGIERLEASCHQEHTASRRVLEKNGFRLERVGPEKHPKWGPDDLFAHFRLDRPQP